MGRNEHWNRIYATKSGEQVSWFEVSPAVSMEFLQLAGLNNHS